MVFKAKVEDNKTYYLCAKREKVTSDVYIKHRKNHTIPDNDSLIVLVQNEPVRIPRVYKGSFNQEEYVCKDVQTRKYQKELYPDVPIFEKPLIGGVQEDCNWLTFGYVGYCTTDMMLSSTGVWTECKNRVVYRYERPIMVLKEGSLRHKRDKEYEELNVDLTTGECILVQRFFNGMMSNTAYKFNKKYRVWEMQSVSIDTGIISIKR